MYTILMDALGLDCHSDLLLQQGANIEPVVEDIAGMILLDFLGEVITMQDVRAHCIVPATADQSSSYHLQVRATSSSESVTLSTAELEFKLEEAITCALLEHFHIVVIHSIDVQYQRTDAPPATHA